MTKPSKKKPAETPPTPKDPYGGPGTHTDLGILPPWDKVYSRGPIVAGRAIFQPPKKKIDENN